MEEGSKALLFSCAPIAVGTLLMLGALYWWRSGRELRQYGITTQGVVVEKRPYRFGKILVVKFADAGGNPRTAEIRIRSRGGGAFREGERVPITYVSSQPEKAEMGLKLGAYIMGWLAWVVAAFGGGMVVFGLYLVIGLLTGRLKPESI